MWPPASRLGLSGPAMLAVGLAFAAMFASAPGQSFLIAVFVDEMLAGTGLSRTAFSALYAAGTVVSALATVIVGRYSDRVGMTAAWLVVGLALAGACLIASAATGAFVAFIALSSLRAFGQGSLPLVATLLVARTLGAMRGRGLSVALFGHTAAGMALPPLVTLLIVGLGWRSAYQILAAAVVLLIVPLALVVRRVALSEVMIAAEEADSDREWPSPVRPSRRLRGRDVPTRAAAALLGIFAVPGIILTGVTFHAISLLERNGFNETDAAIALTAMAASHAVGTLLAGYLADRVGPRILIAGMCAVLGVGTALLLSDAGSVPYVSLSLLGMATGLFMVANGSVWAHMYGTNRLGRIQGLGFAAMISGAAIGPLPLALSLSLFNSYVPGLILFVGIAALALLAAARLRPPGVGDPVAASPAAA